MHRCIIKRINTKSNNRLFSSLDSFALEIEELISVPNSSTCCVNRISFYLINWKLRQWSYHYWFSCFRNLTWINTLLFNNETIIRRSFIWTIRNFTFTINIVIIEYLEGISFSCISHTDSKSLDIVNHSHIFKYYSVSEIITECSLLPTFISYERRSLVACVSLTCSCVSIKLYSVSTICPLYRMCNIIKEFILWIITTVLSHLDISSVGSTSNNIIIDINI